MIRSEACVPRLAVLIWLGSDNDASVGEVLISLQDKTKGKADGARMRRRPSAARSLMLGPARPFAAQRPHLAPSDVPA